MKPKVVVEQIETYENIWDNNVLQLPTILSSPSLDCSVQYKSTIYKSDETIPYLIHQHPVAELGTTDSNIFHYDSQPPRSASKCNRKRVKHIQSHICYSTDIKILDSKIPQNQKQSKVCFRTSCLTDPFDDFITLNDTQQLLRNCNVFHDLSTFVSHKKKSPLSSPSSFANSILKYRGAINCTVPNRLSNS